MDYAQLKKFTKPFLKNTPDYSMGSAILVILTAAAREEDWRTYEKYRNEYRKVDARESAHDDCAVFNLDGLRALSQDKLESLPEIMRSLIKRGQNVQFLGTPNTIVLIEKLVERDLYLEQCREYAALAGPSELLMTIEGKIGAAS